MTGRVATLQQDKSETKTLPPLTVAALFAGIAGIEQGFHRAGHSTSLFCEIDPAALAVLRTRFPNTPVLSDVRELDHLPAELDIVTAGFPCQDLSQAGRTKGIQGARSGLIEEVFRLLEKRRVPWLLIENVPFMLHLGKGEALAVIISALDHLGYRWAYRVVDTRAFGLPQRRRRVYLVASIENDPRTVLYADDAGAPTQPGKDAWQDAACGFYWTEGTRGLGWAHDAVPTLKGGSSIGIPSPPAIVFPFGRSGTRIGTPDIRDAERLQGFDAGWTEPVEEIGTRNYRWRLVGNAVTVNVAEWIGRRLHKFGSYDDSLDTALDRTKSWPSAAYDVGTGLKVPAALSEWPRNEVSEPLADFLEYPTHPLSARATRGFYSRVSSSTLSIPDGFLDVLAKHAKAVST